MTAPQLLARYQEALDSLCVLRARAGCPAADLEDEPQLRTEARRFAQRLACAPDAATAEVDLLADHAGAQAFWALLTTHRETVELLLQPSAFELLPNPLPYEVLCQCFLSMLDTAPAAEVPPAPLPGEGPAGSFQETAGSGSDARQLSPRQGEGQAGAVWEFSDVY